MAIAPDDADALAAALGADAAGALAEAAGDALGAALAAVNFLQRWSWIPRRDACGTPCQSCRHRCEYQAITPAGQIQYSECFQCLDCVSIYQDDQRCLPLIQERKREHRVIPVQLKVEPL